MRTLVLALALAAAVTVLPTADAEPCLADVAGICIADPACHGEPLAACLARLCEPADLCPSRA